MCVRRLRTSLPHLGNEKCVVERHKNCQSLGVIGDFGKYLPAQPSPLPLTNIASLSAGSLVPDGPSSA